MCSLVPQRVGGKGDTHGQMTNAPVTSDFIAYTEVTGGEDEQERKAVMDKGGKGNKWCLGRMRGFEIA